ncbi:MAG: YhhA family cyclophane-containing RiPP [Thiolinea sp.]
MQSVSSEHQTKQSEVNKVAHLDSIVLQRLLDEVKREKDQSGFVGGNYDRAHNRHNR